VEIGFSAKKEASITTAFYIGNYDYTCVARDSGHHHPAYSNAYSDIQT
jgi:hypothetical protein